jgi:hypothetical protein
MDGGNMAMNAGGTPGHEQRAVQTFLPAAAAPGSERSM